MITTAIILIVISIIFIICGFIIIFEEFLGGFTLLFLGLLLGYSGINMINGRITQLENKYKPKVYKIDLPEEISLAKTNDTLYINKITKDSIYLGFKSNKQ